MNIFIYTLMKEVEKDYNYIVCGVCGEKVKRLYGAHLKRHNMTSQGYKEKYPGMPLTTKKDIQNTSKNSGLHMKEEKYKKIFSEKIKGEKNPNHKLNATEQQRKERSPFCLEFHNSLLELEKFRFNALKSRKHTTRLEYYMEKGHFFEAKKMLTDRQCTFSLEKCIKNYGEIKGKKIFTDRQDKWLKSLNENGNLTNGYSKISQELFYNILNEYDIDDRDYVYFATKNHEFKLPKKNGGVWIYDFVDLKRNKIIEYNGDIFHANPSIYESGAIANPFKNIIADDIWKKDEEKLKAAKQNGFYTLIIWDSDYKKNKFKTINDCLNFLL